jgi:hypothetical protein
MQAMSLAWPQQQLQMSTLRLNIRSRSGVHAEVECIWLDCKNAVRFRALASSRSIRGLVQWP